MKFRLQFFQNIGPGYLWRVRLFPIVWYGDNKAYYWPFNVFLHIFWRSDHDRALHDHPWPSLSFKLWGKVSEWYWVDFGRISPAGNPVGLQRHRKVPPLLPVFRGAKFRHRIVLDGKVGVTLFMVGFKQRTWGFWPNGQFVRWTEYEGAVE